MPDQLDLLDHIRDLEAARRARDAGMARAEAGSEEEWVERAVAAVLETARRQPTFTPDDVWDRLDRPAGDPRALGPVMRRLQREGRIVPTGEWRASDRPSQHATPIRVWRAAP